MHNYLTVRAIFSWFKGANAEATTSDSPQKSLAQVLILYQ